MTHMYEVCVYMYICIQVCIYVCMCKYIYIYIYTHTYIHIKIPPDGSLTFSPSVLSSSSPLHIPRVIPPWYISQGVHVYTMVYGYTSEITPRIPRRIPEIP